MKHDEWGMVKRKQQCEDERKVARIWTRRRKGNKVVVRQMGSFIWHNAFLFSSPGLKNSRETVRTIFSGKRWNAMRVMRRKHLSRALKVSFIGPW